MYNLKDLSGRTFGRLSVLSRAENDRHGQARWNCVCECGAESVVLGGHLRGGSAKSCGCLRREISAAKAAETHRTHGRSGTPEYFSWRNAKAYGSKRMCDRWKDSFENFLADMGERPEGFRLVRADPRGGYSPDNCRWADRRK